MRNSNIELLRIIAMTFIVIWHISIHAQKGEAISHDCIGAVTITGVNIFLLITGYFGLKLRWRSYLNIIAMVIFYSSISIAANYLCLNNLPNKRQLFEAINPFGLTTYWFVNCYIILMLLSPALNFIKEKTTNKQHLYIVGVLVYLSCIIGLLLKVNINRNGYNIMQFIMMYFIGDALKRYNITNRIKLNLLIAVYIAMTLILWLGGWLNIAGTYAYNNPPLILAAICLFCIVEKQNFSNKHINSIAKCMFPIYLIQEGFFGRKIYGIIYDLGVEYNLLSYKYILTIFTYVIALFAAAIILEHLRQKLMNPIIDRFSNYLDKRVNIFP